MLQLVLQLGNPGKEKKKFWITIQSWFCEAEFKCTKCWHMRFKFNNRILFQIGTGTSWNPIYSFYAIICACSRIGTLQIQSYKEIRCRLVWMQFRWLNSWILHCVESVRSDILDLLICIYIFLKIFCLK